MTTSLTLDGTDYSGQYTDLAWYQDYPPKGDPTPARITALACENPTGDLLTYVATHQGATVDVVAVCRGTRITGTCTITGASRWTFAVEAPATTEPA